MRGELRILLSSSFGANNPFGFAIFSRSDVEDSFLASRHKLFLAGGHTALSPAKLYALSRGQLFMLCFSQAVVIAGG